MAETLGSLCDKLTIVKLKQFHTEDAVKLKSLSAQELQLQSEIDEFISAALSGNISPERLTFSANKVYKQSGNTVADVSGNIGTTFSQLADVNCRLWHQQEYVYDFENVPSEEKNGVIKQLALLNLERTRCIDHIDKQFQALIKQKKID
jgi:aconitase B